MNKHRSDRSKQFLRRPVYEGGNKALRAFIDAHLQYPSTALGLGIEGDVHVRYDVDESGKVSHAHILRGIGGGCDEEALRVVRLLQFKPVRNRGKKVTQHYDIVLHFRLNVASSSAGPDDASSAGGRNNHPAAQTFIANAPAASTGGVHLVYTYVPVARPEGR